MTAFAWYLQAFTSSSFCVWSMLLNYALTFVNNCWIVNTISLLYNDLLTDTCHKACEVRWKFWTHNKIVEPGQLSRYRDGLWAGLCGFVSGRDKRLILYFTASRPALEPNQLPMLWTPGAFSLGIMRPRREPDHLPPSNAEVKNDGPITLLPYTILRGAAYIIKHRTALNSTEL
jgi:hypothetical protein